METAIVDAQALLGLAGLLLQVGLQAEPYIAQAITVLRGDKVLTSAERTSLVAQQQELSAQLQAMDPGI